MSYSIRTIKAIRSGPRSLGNRLGRAAITLDISVLEIAECTGVARQTVYNWVLGIKNVSPAYTPVVERMIAAFTTTQTKEQAWQKFNTAL